MNTNQITQLLIVGQRALELHAATSAVRMAKNDYHDAISAYEEEEGRMHGRIDPDNRIYDGVIAATKTEYDFYLDSKRIANNIKNRLNNACKKALIGAAT